MATGKSQKKGPPPAAVSLTLAGLLGGQPADAQALGDR